MSSVPAEDRSAVAPFPDHEDFATLVHELRQPLSTIETCAYFLRTILDGLKDERIAENLDRIERQVAEAHRILLEAAEARAQRAASRCLTKAASGGDR